MAARPRQGRGFRQQARRERGRGQQDDIEVAWRLAAEDDGAFGSQPREAARRAGQQRRDGAARDAREGRDPVRDGVLAAGDDAGAQRRPCRRPPCLAISAGVSLKRRRKAAAKREALVKP
jgi:hypothetical protein